jgi:putative heme iron utilization protein
MDKDEIQKRIVEDEDYIRSPKNSNSITKFLAKNPDGVEDSVIARLLVMTEERVKKIYEEAVKILRRNIED